MATANNFRKKYSLPFEILFYRTFSVVLAADSPQVIEKYLKITRLFGGKSKSF